ILALGMVPRWREDGTLHCVDAMAQRSEEDLSLSLPRPERLIVSFDEGHAAHGTGVDIPRVQPGDREGPARVRRTQQVNVAVHVLGSRAVQAIEGAARIGEDPQGAASASTCRLRRYCALLRKGAALVRGPRDPDLPTCFPLGCTRPLTVPRNVDIPVPIGRYRSS